jgi:hypothetical protein
MATPAYGAQAGTAAEPNNAALYDARRRAQVTGSQILDNIVTFSNCTSETNPKTSLLRADWGCDCSGD